VEWVQVQAALPVPVPKHVPQVLVLAPQASLRADGASDKRLLFGACSLDLLLEDILGIELVLPVL